MSLLSFPEDSYNKPFLFIADLDFCQVMKAIGGLRGQVAALVTTVGEVSENQGAVKELAEVKGFPAFS